MGSGRTEAIGNEQRTKAIGWKPRKKVAGPEMQGTRYWRIRILRLTRLRLPHAPALPFILGNGSYNVLFLFVFFWDDQSSSPLSR